MQISENHVTSMHFHVFTFVILTNRDTFLFIVILCDIDFFAHSEMSIFICCTL